jgi:hypothetical protein
VCLPEHVSSPCGDVIDCLREESCFIGGGLLSSACAEMLIRSIPVKDYLTTPLRCGRVVAICG